MNRLRAFLVKESKKIHFGGIFLFCLHDKPYSVVLVLYSIFFKVRNNFIIKTDCNITSFERKNK
jgi:hypothetical protein